MEIKMDPLQRQMLDDVFDAFSMLAGKNYVSLMHVEAEVTRYSPGAVELFGLPGEYIPNGEYDWTQYIHPEDRSRYLDVMLPLIEGKILTYDLNYRVRTKDGNYINTWQVGAVLRNAAGKPSLIGGMVVNEGVMDHTDPVTVLRNKAGLISDLNDLLEQDKKPLLLMLGIRKLDSINRRYGFSYGNRVLQETAWMIQETVGDRGRVYRTDGAAFVALTERCTSQETAAIYDALRLRLQRGIPVEGVRHNIALCGGLLSVENRNAGAETLYSCLSSACRESRHRYGELVDFNGSTNYDAKKSLEMVSAIRDCILENCRGFLLRYQPVYRMSDGAMIGVETLLRWEGEPYGEVLPGSFLPVLEDDAIFEVLGEWIFRQAMTETLPLLETRPDFLLGVNVSATELAGEYFTDTVLDIAEGVGFPLKNLCLELTRGCRLLDPERLQSLAAALREREVRILIDDFGIGVDSIGFMRSLVSDYVKFDPALLRGIEEHDEIAVQSVGCLAGLGTLYGTKVCVKGVTTARARDALKDSPVYAMQGNLFSPALPAEELLRHHP